MFVVGVDGGTTKTIALVADTTGQVISAARGGGSNWTGEEVDIPMAVVVNTVRDALDVAGLTGADIALGMFALAGADWPEDHTRRADILRKAGLARREVVKNDAFAGLRAGTRKPFGIVLAAGTGMNAAVISPEGEEWAFGYYDTLGGAGALARGAFIAVLRAEDGRGRPTLLTQRVLQHMAFPTVEALLRASVTRAWDEGRYYALPSLVFQAAHEGDEVATDILVEYGKRAAEYATALARRYAMCGQEFDVVLAGSLFKGVGPLLIDTITQEVHRVAPEAHIVRAGFEPAVGSVLLAYDALGVAVTDAMFTRLHETAPDATLFDTSRGQRPAPTRGDVQEEAG